MKRVILAGVSALAVVTMMGAANAADLPIRQQMPTKAPLYSAPYNWTGFYLGINGGGAFGRSNWNGVGSGFDTSGGLVGGTIGYNWQFNQTVIGLEGDADWSSIRGSTSSSTLGSVETRNDYLATVRGRVGYAFDRILPYVTGGLAIGNVKADTPFTSSDNTRAGWTVGGGLEFALAGPWTAKVEYLYADLGKDSTLAGTNVDFHTNVVRAGLNYRF
ncbi:MAG TPA: outer membrane protein [Pseudolabrys sp.]|jgi:outer membrane immunogenic protein|nr:outer membrane protein [Pseudolabrys sp.]